MAIRDHLISFNAGAGIGAFVTGVAASVIIFGGPAVVAGSGAASDTGIGIVVAAGVIAGIDSFFTPKGVKLKPGSVAAGAATGFGIVAAFGIAAGLSAHNPAPVDPSTPCPAQPETHTLMMQPAAPALPSGIIVRQAVFK